MSREAQTLATDIALRRFDHQLTAMATARAALTTLVGIQSSVALGVLALSFRDRRTPPLFSLILGLVLLIAGFLVATWTLFMSRDQVQPPMLGEDASGIGAVSSLDLQKNYLNALEKVLVDNLRRLKSFDIQVGLVAVLLLASSVFMTIGLSQARLPKDVTGSGTGGTPTTGGPAPASSTQPPLPQTSTPVSQQPPQPLPVQGSAPP